MFVTRNNINKLLNNPYDSSQYIENETNTQIFQLEIQRYIKLIDDIMNLDFDTLPDKEFYNLLNQVYYISFDSYDYFEILSKKNKKDYLLFSNIPTTMIYKKKTNKIRVGMFKTLYYEHYFMIYYEAVVSTDLYRKGLFRTCCEGQYTKNEIRNMLNNKDIVIFKEDSRVLYKMDLDRYRIEKPQKFPSIEISDIYEKNNMEKFIKNNFELSIELLRKRFSKKRVLEDIKKYIEEANNSIDRINLNNNCIDNNSKIFKLL